MAMFFVHWQGISITEIAARQAEVLRQQGRVASAGKGATAEVAEEEALGNTIVI